MSRDTALINRTLAWMGLLMSVSVVVLITVLG